ncbi:MAG: hypothetical protein H0U76_12295 [Ktedonobacteraceae bacterium]|nr:hypothetical protein [Ktedonobacteraceae bacterium]MBA3822473.1 hypothetical protein [Ktedonobacterales bacterium]
MKEEILEQVSEFQPSDDEQNAQPAPLFTKEMLIESAYNSFQSGTREQISKAEIAKVVESLDLDDLLREKHAPQLQVHRLRFSGIKHLNGQEEPIPFVYDQAFASGVNVLLIEDNEVGKSSIWKTIKFALTGDDDDYDKDVKSWIKDIWLCFTLDNNPYTVIISRPISTFRAILVPTFEVGPLEAAAYSTSVIFDAVTLEMLKGELQNFFFNRLGLTQLAWNQETNDAFEHSNAERKASWLTYFQGVLIPDGGERYLLCDTKHNYGNQSGLILSAFLGLSFADPLNRLSVQVSAAKKELNHQKEISDEEVKKAEEQIRLITAQLSDAKEHIKGLTSQQRIRREAFESSDINRRVIDLQAGYDETRVTIRSLTEEREQLNQSIQRERNRERQLREAVLFHLHFTGIEVTLCPNCDNEIEEDSRDRERETHVCRLCGKPAHNAPAQELAAMKAEADNSQRLRLEYERGREALTREIQLKSKELGELEEQLTQTQKVATQGIAYALPNEEEENERERLLTLVGTLQRDLILAQEKLQGRQPEMLKLDNQRRIFEKVRDMLKREASRRNLIKLNRLTAITQDFARKIGAESVTNVSCSTYGVVRLEKHGQQVSFSSINNDGERLRVKLAFFLAMMQLSREMNGGHHPGFLIIDQPGSSEMVDSDFMELANIFHQIDQDFRTSMQILCFTARKQFRNATDEDRVYGPQAFPFAF